MALLSTTMLMVGSFSVVGSVDKQVVGAWAELRDHGLRAGARLCVGTLQTTDARAGARATGAQVHHNVVASQAGHRDPLGRCQGESVDRLGRRRAAAATDIVVSVTQRAPEDIGRAVLGVDVDCVLAGVSDRWVDICTLHPQGGALKVTLGLTGVVADSNLVGTICWSTDHLAHPIDRICEGWVFCTHRRVDVLQASTLVVRDSQRVIRRIEERDLKVTDA